MEIGRTEPDHLCGQERLVQEEHRYRLLVNAVRDCGIFLLDPSGRIDTWSEGAEQITGFASADVLGRSCACLYPIEDVEAGKPFALLRVAASDGRIENEGWQVRKDGSRFRAEVIITAIKDSSETLVGYAEITRDSTVRIQLERDLGEAQERLRALAAHITRNSEEEKMSLAREIHDVLGQALTGLKLDSAWLARRLQRVSEPGLKPLFERLDAMDLQLDTCMKIVQRIATGLRPGVLDDIGLAAAIEWQSKEFEQRTGLKIDLTLPVNTLNLDRERATATFRIFQELVTNMVRHAQATKASVVLGLKDGAIVLEFLDDGRGITQLDQSRPDALGILGMRERAAQFGGSVTLRGAPGRGTRASVRIPV